MITKKLVDQIEGEAFIYFKMKKGVVDFSTITFPHFRGMESILEGKNALDALVITPRVCGICGHAHLMAAVRAIESAYENANNPIALTKKAQNIREFTLVMEMIQNHLKWLYLVVIPHIETLTDSKRVQTPLKGAYSASIAAKAIATFAGQWPHSSYMVPGGVTCDPTHVDKIKAQNHLQELSSFFEKESLGVNLDTFLSSASSLDFENIESDISLLESDLRSCNMHLKGFAHDRFIVLGDHTFSKSSGVDYKYVTTVESYSPQEKSYARNALYKDQYFETGPLARLLEKKVPVIEHIHKNFSDSAYTRVMARVYETAYLIKHASNLLTNVEISAPSCIKPKNISEITAHGVGIVEAPRGPLIHKVEIKAGIIQKYEIITPTQWNIGSSTKENPTPAQKAMIGTTKEESLFIFRTFDVCSVCTTH